MIYASVALIGKAVNIYIPTPTLAVWSTWIVIAINAFGAFWLLISLRFINYFKLNNLPNLEDKLKALEGFDKPVNFNKFITHGVLIVALILNGYYITSIAFIAMTAALLVIIIQWKEKLKGQLINNVVMDMIERSDELKRRLESNDLVD